MENILDALSKTKPIGRELYGNDKNIKPNDYCCWDNRFSHWIENDEHFRLRISEQRKDKIKES